jgi:hypothetical protein
MNEEIRHGYRQVAFREDVGKETVGIQILMKLPPGVEADGLNAKLGYKLHHMAEEVMEGVRVIATTQAPDFQEKKNALRSQFRVVFAEAGLAPVYMKEIPNEYCAQACCLHRPWLIVTTRVGHFKIGWRKSVMNIDWKETELAANGEQLFANEGVTVGERFIHAWSYGKATAYLRKLLEDSQ